MVLRYGCDIAVRLVKRRLRQKPYLVDREFREECLRLLVRHGRVDDDIVALLPVDGSGDTVLVADLESYFCERLSASQFMYSSGWDIQSMTLKRSMWFSETALVSIVVSHTG